jgi:hypothetical protein
MKKKSKGKLKWTRRQMGRVYEWMLHGQHPKLVTALAHRKDVFEGELELRVILDPRTGKPWTSIKKMREWLDEALRKTCGRAIV